MDFQGSLQPEKLYFYSIYILGLGAIFICKMVFLHHPKSCNKSPYCASINNHDRQLGDGAKGFIPCPRAEFHGPIDVGNIACDLHQESYAYGHGKGLKKKKQPFSFDLTQSFPNLFTELFYALKSWSQHTIDCAFGNADLLHSLF